MKCVALLLCDKVIIDKGGAHSLINLMTAAYISAETGNPPSPVVLPSNAVSPQAWWIYTQWLVSDEDIGKRFEQHYEVFWPNGDKFASSKLEFAQPNDQTQQTTFFIVGMPVGQQGNVRVVTWLESDGRRVTEQIQALLKINHGEPPAEAGQMMPSVAMIPGKP